MQAPDFTPLIILAIIGIVAVVVIPIFVVLWLLQ
jgi:hypothetical protein